MSENVTVYTVTGEVEPRPSGSIDMTLWAPFTSTDFQPVLVGYLQDFSINSDVSTTLYTNVLSQSSLPTANPPWVRSAGVTYTTAFALAASERPEYTVNQASKWSLSAGAFISQTVTWVNPAVNDRYTFSCYLSGSPGDTVATEIIQYGGFGATVTVLSSETRSLGNVLVKFSQTALWTASFGSSYLAVRVRSVSTSNPVFITSLQLESGSVANWYVVTANGPMNGWSSWTGTLWVMGFTASNDAYNTASLPMYYTGNRYRVLNTEFTVISGILGYPAVGDPGVYYAPVETPPWVMLLTDRNHVAVGTNISYFGSWPSGSWVWTRFSESETKEYLSRNVPVYWVAGPRSGVR